MRKPLMAGNWKMNLNHLEAIAVAQKLVYSLDDKDYDAVDVAIIPPFTDIRSIQTLIDGDRLRLLYGAQDLSPEASGAFTGDISGSMLAKLGCTFVVIGHSERRADHAETNAQVKAKAEAALAAQLIAIVCLGETEAQRDAGETLALCGNQLHGSIPAGATAANLVIAYEPVWAIGTGRTPTIPEIAEVHAFLRARLTARIGAEAAGVRLLYGGSVKPSNAAEIFAVPHVDGALVGGASLKASDFGAIVAALSGFLLRAAALRWGWTLPGFPTHARRV